MTGVCAAAAMADGSNALTVVTVRNIAAVALLAAWLGFAGVSFALPARDLGIAALVAIPLAANNYLLNAAFAYIPVPLAVLIFYLWPAITAAASGLLGHERVGWRLAVGLAAAFAGVALALEVEFTAGQARGAWYAAGAAVAWSAAFLLTGRYYRGRSTLVPTFYMMGTTLVFFGLACVVTRAVAWPGSAAGWTAMGGVGVFYAFGLIGLFAASARLGPARAGFFMNFEPVAAVVLAALILGQRLAPVQLAGAALVVAALFLFRPPPPRRP